MKKTSIVLLILVAAAVGIIVAVFAKDGFSTYETFASAAQQPGKQIYVIGFMDKNKQTAFDPKNDPNHFNFFAKDKQGNESQVIFNGAKPTDIEKSEQIVMHGYMDAGTFHCKSIQMKCPSKYKKDQIAIGS